ncbi:hypothetical protein ACNHE5_08510 [Pandoraea pnomenusa]|uniref:hypothetical protein n=1 Tax=Pandoraea pnomenusa TaxID=93220 RepID=UPI003CF3D3DF
MDKHTPGPWSVRFDFVVQATSFDEGRLVPVAQPYGVNTDGTDLFANARLIAAAPELLEALDSVLQSLQTGVPETIGYGEQTKKAFSEGWNAVLNAVYERAADARAAISKARGAA